MTRGCNPPRNDRFCPDQPVTRGQMAAFLRRALGGDAPDRHVPFWNIVGSRFFDDIVWLAHRGVTKGCNPPQNDRFCPDQPITRGQMAAFLARALELPAANNVFADTADHPFRHEIARLAAAGITRGCDPPANTRFCPGEPVTRAEMAVFLVRAGLVDVG